MIVFAQMLEHTRKFIAFQQGNFDQRHLENQHGDPQFFLHFLIGNGLKNVSTKFEQNRIGFENS